MTTRHPYPHVGPVIHDDGSAASFLRMVGAVSAVCGVPVERILGSGRTADMLVPRLALVRMARRTGRASTAIGRLLGCRHHTTILYYWRRSEEERERRSRLWSSVEAVERAATVAIESGTATAAGAGMTPRDDGVVMDEDGRPRLGHGFIGGEGEIICDP